MTFLFYCRRSHGVTETVHSSNVPAGLENILLSQFTGMEYRFTNGY